MNTVITHIKAAKKASYDLASLNDEQRQRVLLSLAELIRQSVVQIIQENSKDLALMAKEDPKYDRLMLTEKQINAIADDVALVSSLPQPVGRILEEKILPNGLHINKLSVPLGVVAVIYESRPNVTIDVFTLCFKAGNACILKGGKEAEHSNRFLLSLIHQALKLHGIDSNCVYLLPPEREATHQLLGAVNLIDVCIPRGSQDLINFVREHAKIPVIETGAGIVHTYFDLSGSLEKGRLIINNAKTRRVSVCNALDTLIVHQQCLDKLYFLVELLADNHVELFADERSYQALNGSYPSDLLHQAKQGDFGIEFLSYKMSIKTVDSIAEAVQHIMQYTSGHSEAIIAEDKAAIQYFMTHVDAAALYANASTAFTDGGQFGMGAEIGISTQKLHARGPMGLEALTSYKWIVYGDGQIRG
ncbi:glutamate-5-semialdehyde dehydrogenase [Legionella quateirensis]|uniref:Gamma-glutamyl phosphate reductase n=1 Tax=Legionella quateirensis TaxID=45072 RepID=A0A378KRJ0_9GAMM|nr:glutamate-5-semialdehyde dehydrogenase [Legionella quateirensis]KTD54756.1 gamma-glutamyl phosphate reductase [Legionella quateirensis]STY16936.1 gamma-glutamyl phosphate reductase [Legionella quateirensis]